MGCHFDSMEKSCGASKITQTQKQVRSAVEQVLDSNLPGSYDRVLFREKCDNVFYLMLDYASHGRKWAV